MSVEIFLRFANQYIRITADSVTSNLLKQNYSRLIVPKPSHTQPSLEYAVQKQDDVFVLNCPKDVNLEGIEDSRFIYLFEKDLTINLQEQRRDLFFMHGACLNLGDKTIIITGESGAGKSTTTWALTHHGFSYLSDELSPIDLNSMEVHPYSHALCLKNVPPEPYSLPEETLKTEYTMHVPAEYLNGGVHDGPAKLTHLFFVQYNKEQQNVLLEPVESTAAASMQIYKNTLNHLCHEDAGLPAATKVASHCDCYTLEFNDVSQACLKIRDVLKES